TTVGHVLLSARRPSWRLAAISDAGARALRIFPLPAALVIALSVLAQRFVALASGSLGLAVALTGLAAALVTALLLVVLLRIQRLQARAGTAEAPRGHFRPWMNIALSVGWIGVGVSVLGLLTGYVALSAFVAMQLA